ncbi:MAG: hypothetical protein ACREDL_25655 [Bradyrhizobium sp.]
MGTMPASGNDPVEQIIGMSSLNATVSTAIIAMAGAAARHSQSASRTAGAPAALAIMARLLF